MEIKKILICFKTHLDLGYTDTAANVKENYMKSILPAAINTAKQLRESGGKSRLVWTTGAWLISEFLRTQGQQEVQQMRDAINAGDVYWHGLPFTMHTDIMSTQMLEYGISLGSQLDQEFGRKSIAAKMTDVPGHSKALIPILKKAGLEFLHIGVNPASMMPDVPEIFRWRCDTGETINVMYQADYGDFTLIGDTGTALYFAHTGDNHGCQSAQMITELFESLQSKYPDAELVAANLDDVALAVREIEDTLPIITDEIGDTWIHGPSSDPKLLAQYRGMERLYLQLPEGEDKQILARNMLMIPEHSWGRNGERNLTDHCYFKRSVFEEKRKTMPVFRMMEESWEESRRYLTDVVDALSSETKAKAQAVLDEASRAPAETAGGREVPMGETVQLGGSTLQFNRQGEIVYLEQNGKVLADAKHRLLTLVYEQFSDDDYKRFYYQYVRKEYVPGCWGAMEDFTKIGMYHGVDCYSRYCPKSADVFAFEDRIVIKYHFPELPHKEYGCPEVFDLTITEEEGQLHFDLAWFNKPANRVAEAIWIGFRPVAKEKRIRKFGQNIDPRYVVRNGQCRLHGTDYGVVYDELDIQSLDAAIVAPQEPSLLNFCNIKPADEDPVYFNLFNNLWGTNFPMWFEDDMRFRFVLHQK